MMYRLLATTAAAAILISLPGEGRAQEEDANRVNFLLNARVRVETVDEDNALLDATSTTARIRAGIETPKWDGFDGIAELEAIGNLGPEDFNSGSNGRTQYSAVLDHEDVELNQLALRYRDSKHYVQLGRQRMVLDNGRHFGDVGYRQNQQTYDALTYMNTALQGQQFRYAYMVRVRRFLSDEHPLGEIDMNSHLLNYRLQRLNGDVFTAYAYLVDMDTQAVAQNSTKTFGARYSGTYAAGPGDILYALEYANQSDYADGLSTNDADYLVAEVGFKFRNEWVIKVAQERLGGDGTYGFQFPFGTNHIFNGYADRFAARTPPNGVIDSYAALIVPVWGARIQLTAHDFAADQGSADHGTELDLRFEKRFAERFAISAMFADYSADNFSVDTTKFGLWIDFRY